ncbi:MAG: hypothetical protein JSU89_15450 [Myxococcales bacterium]|nr:MAG: hypothetical protein JSU89_15450 [Myxococcales bacterium]
MARAIRGILKRLLYWIWAEEIGGLRTAATQALGNAVSAVEEVKRLRKQLSAVMAIDVDLHDGGKAVLLTRVNGEDRCKIIPIEPDLTMEQYRAFVKSIEETYGARVRYADMPAGWPKAYVLTGEGR